jgi:hypothetical protein
MHRLGDGTKYDAIFHQLLLVSGGNADTVEHGVHRNVGKTFLLIERNAQLLKSL